MKKITALLLALLLTLTACGQSDQDKLYDEMTKKTSSAGSVSMEASEPESSAASSEAEPIKLPEPDESVSGEITVRDCFDPNGQPSQLLSFVREFRKLYPNVTVHVEYYCSDTFYSRKDIEEVIESYNAKIRMELVSGEADYILPPSRGLNMYELSKSGVFRDMRPYFDSDPDIDPEDYYTQVLDAVSVDGKLTFVPVSFILEGLYLDRKLMEALEVDLDAIKTVDCYDLLDWYDQGREVQPDVEVLAGGWMMENLFALEKPVYIDWETRTASFDSPEFVEYLERTGTIIEENENLGEVSRTLSTDPGVIDIALHSWDEGRNLFSESNAQAWDIVDKGHPAVAVLSGISTQELAHVTVPFDYLAGPYPAVTSKGDLVVTPRQGFAVPSSMKDPDLAWKFISYCIRQRADARFENGGSYTSDIPINRHNVQPVLDALRGNQDHFHYDIQAGYPMKDYDAQAGAEKLDEFLTLPLVNAKIYEVDMLEYLDEFYVNKLTTPEQCAEKIQGRAYIWLNE